MVEGNNVAFHVDGVLKMFRQISCGDEIVREIGDIENIRENNRPTQLPIDYWINQDTSHQL